MHLLREPKRFSNYLYRVDKLRLIIKPFRASELMSYALQVCWNSVRNNEALTAIIAEYMLKVITRLAGYAGTGEDLQVLQMHAEAISRSTASDNSMEEYERTRIQERYQEAVRAFTTAGKLPDAA